MWCCVCVCVLVCCSMCVCLCVCERRSVWNWFETRKMCTTTRFNSLYCISVISQKINDYFVSILCLSLFFVVFFPVFRLSRCLSMYSYVAAVITFNKCRRMMMMMTMIMIIFIVISFSSSTHTHRHNGKRTLYSIKLEISLRGIFSLRILYRGIAQIHTHSRCSSYRQTSIESYLMLWLLRFDCGIALPFDSISIFFIKAIARRCIVWS